MVYMDQRTPDMLSLMGFFFVICVSAPGQRGLAHISVVLSSSALIR